MDFPSRASLTIANYRRGKPLAVCYRCGAKFMSQSWSEYN
jgi:hypothetical protein